MRHSDKETRRSGRGALSPRLLVAVLCLVAVLPALTPLRASAQELTPAVADRCVRAAVKIVGLGTTGSGTTGSGSLIDARGYILTNFHVVGHLTAEGGVPGTLINAENRYAIATVDSARQGARPRFVAAVVRADVRLDLALLRIVSDQSGHPVRGAPFTTVELGHTRTLRPGSALWAFGFPLGVRTINVTGGHVTGFEMNARDDVAWLRSDAEFNPGNSGGMLVDAHGRLMAVPTQVLSGASTLEPVELARPAERIPARWLAELRRGAIDDTRIDGVPMLSTEHPTWGEAVGDRAWFSRGEVAYFLVPPHDRPARVQVEGADVEVLVGTLSGETLASGHGSVRLPPSDENLLGGVVLPAHPEQPLSYRLIFGVDAAPAHPPRVASTETAPNAAPFVQAGAPSAAANPAAQAQARPRLPYVTPAPFAMALPGPGLPGQDASAQNQPSVGVAPGARVTIRGRMLDAMTGRPVVGGLVIVGRPGVALRSYLTAFLAGRIGEPQLDAVLVQAARTDVSGHYTLTQLPADTVYPAAGMARDYPPVMLTFTVHHEASVIDMNAIQMTR